MIENFKLIFINTDLFYNKIIKIEVNQISLAVGENNEQQLSPAILQACTNVSTQNSIPHLKASIII